MKGLRELLTCTLVLCPLPIGIGPLFRRTAGPGGGEAALAEGLREPPGVALVAICPPKYAHEQAAEIFILSYHPSKPQSRN